MGLGGHSQKFSQIGPKMEKMLLDNLSFPPLNKPFLKIPPGYFAILCPIKNITLISCDFYQLLQEINVIFLIGYKMAKYPGGRYFKNPVDEARTNTHQNTPTQQVSATLRKAHQGVSNH